ncbi:unnamed protein product, partial [Staurois parvus]
MGPPTDPGPSGSARVSKLAVRPGSTVEGEVNCLLLLAVGESIDAGCWEICCSFSGSIVAGVVFCFGSPLLLEKSIVAMGSIAA